MTSRCHCGTAMMQQSTVTGTRVHHRTTSTTTVLPQYTGAKMVPPWCCHNPMAVGRLPPSQEPPGLQEIAQGLPKDQDKLDGKCSAVTSIETNEGDLLQGSARAGAQFPPHRCSSAAGAPTNTPLNQPPALLPIPAFPPGLPPGHST